MHEFDVIARYFTRTARANVDLSVGDDAALVRLTSGHQLAISTDMSVVNTHFFAETDPHAIGWKAMAVNVSDMAAMGAQPKWATLAIAMPQIDSTWLEKFSSGLFACADAFDISLIGGDTTRGPLNIAITVMGEVPAGKALCRSGAKVGDDIWISGDGLGSAALWLQAQLGKCAMDHDDMISLSKSMHYPQPRVALGLALRNIAHSALDLSDGLLADLGHILEASGVGAVLDWSRLPQPHLRHSVISKSLMQQVVLAGGDEYELCFTARRALRENVQALSIELGLPLHRVGVITESLGVTVIQDNSPIEINQKGYNHFAQI